MYISTEPNHIKFTNSIHTICNILSLDLCATISAYINLVTTNQTLLPYAPANKEPRTADLVPQIPLNFNIILVEFQSQTLLGIHRAMETKPVDWNMVM